MVVWWRHLSILSSNTVSSRRLKVLFAINCLNIGGAPSVVVNQLKGLDKNKFEPYLLTLYPSKAANFLGEVNTFLPASQQRHFKLKNRSIFDLKTLWQIYRFLRQERFDIVYTHLFLTNLIVRALAVLAGVKTIVSFEHSTYFNKNRWQLMVDKILKHFTQAVVVSTETVADFTREQQKLSGEQVVIIPNPLSVPIPESVNIDNLRREFGINQNLITLVTIGRFSSEKGHSLLIEAIKQLTEVKAQFLILGHGPLEKSLRQKVADLKLEEQVKIIVAPDRAKEFLYLAEALILPSLREGQGLVAYEALLAGVPVISADLPALKEIIIDGENGLLFEVGQVSALTAVLTKFLTNEALRGQLKEGVKNRPLNSPTLESVEKLSELFYDLSRLS